MLQDSMSSDLFLTVNVQSLKDSILFKKKKRKDFIKYSRTSLNSLKVESCSFEGSNVFFLFDFPPWLSALIPLAPGASAVAPQARQTPPSVGRTCTVLSEIQRGANGKKSAGELLRKEQMKPVGPVSSEASILYLKWIPRPDTGAPSLSAGRRALHTVFSYQSHRKSPGIHC